MRSPANPVKGPPTLRTWSERYDLSRLKTSRLPHVIFNPYKPSVPFLGHMQNETSDQGLHYLLTRISIRNRIKMKKITPDTPKIGNGLSQLIRMDGFTRQMWANKQYLPDPPLSRTHNCLNGAPHDFITVSVRRTTTATRSKLAIRISVAGPINHAEMLTDM